MTTTLGFHPTQSKLYNQQSDQQLLNLYEKYHEKITFMGELGLDYDRLHFSNKETQQKVLKNQLIFIAKNNIQKPLFIHSRQAQQDILNIIQEVENQFNFKFQGVFHSFTGNSQEIKILMQKGFYVSFNGLIFKQNDWKQTVSQCFIDKILTESDCPYCGVKRSFLQEFDIKLQKVAQKGRNEPVGALDVEYVLSKYLNIDQFQLRQKIFENLQNLISFK